MLVGVVVIGSWEVFATFMFTHPASEGHCIFPGNAT